MSNTRSPPGWRRPRIYSWCRAARGHEYVRVSAGGIRTKLGIDATVPFAEQARFARCEFKPVEIDAKAMTTDAAAARKRLDL
jgi:2,5-furandicarboxylate decarboxylase 1